jgi:DNA replication protein DnaC
LSELVSTRIRNTAGKLGLPHLAETIREYTRRADEGKMGYLDFLDLVLSEELAVRDDRRFRQGLRLSKLPHHKMLDEYDFSFQPDLDPRKVKDLATLSFVEGKANAALLGPPGVGKTHIAVSLAVAACRAGYSIPTCGPASSWSTRSATSSSNEPRRTWSSRSSPSATRRARSS